MGACFSTAPIRIIDEGAAAGLDGLQLLLAHQHVADAGLGVGVDHEDLLAVVVGQRLGQRQDERRLADAALGVHDGDGIAHPEPLEPVARTTARRRQDKALSKEIL